MQLIGSLEADKGLGLTVVDSSLCGEDLPIHILYATTKLFGPVSGILY